VLTSEQAGELKRLINASLDNAEAVWSQHGNALTKAAMTRLSERAQVPTPYPGVPIIAEGGSQVGDFLVMAVDMRDSTKHLRHEISAKSPSCLQRVYFETSALLPATATVIGYDGGKVAEYIGDGVLAFFHVPEASRETTYYAALRAARNTMTMVGDILNPILGKRYALPAISIGVGLARSKSIISVVGTGDIRIPKAFGLSVFFASKLSKGDNEIYIDEILQKDWPTEKGAKLRFRKKTLRGEEGYLVEESAS